MKTKTKKEKNIEKNINFKRIFEIFTISYFSYFSFVLMLLESIQYQNLILFFLPVPVYIILATVFIEIDNKRTIDNYYLNLELKKIKDMYKIRKKVEEFYDQ